MEKAKQSSEMSSINNVIWDCGSSLYDSFELKTFKQQLDSAILSSRSLSMPHLTDRRLAQPPLNKKSTSKIYRSLQRLIRSVFKPKRSNANNTSCWQQKEGFYVVYDKSAALTTIPEASEFDPEIKSFVRRTASYRFTTATSNIGHVSCI